MVRPLQAPVAPAAVLAAQALRSGVAVDALLAGVVDAVAAAAEVDAALLLPAWRAADPAQLVVALDALSQVGVPYRRLGDRPELGFDCSGLTSWSWANVGVELPHASGGQLALEGHHADQAQLADLVGYPGHVMLYVGGGVIVHAPYSGTTVEVQALRRHVDHFVTPAFVAGVTSRNAFVMPRVRVF